MELNRKTYHSLEAERAYMSRSQFQSFIECEARQIAKLAGEWAEETPVHFLVGSFTHSWCEGTLSEFTAEHPEMFKKDGCLKAEFQHALTMIQTLESDPFAMHVLTGEKEQIFTAELFGVLWKVMIDVHVPGKRNTDLKTTKSIYELAWSQEHGGKVNFLEQFNYPMQYAIYSEVERKANGRPEGEWLPFYAVAVSKEKVPDKEVIELTDPDRLQVELAKVGAHMPRILAVKEGRVEPVRCGRCPYCLTTKRLTRAIHYTEIGT